MKAVFYIVALLVVGGAVYFTLEVKGKFEEQQATRLETIKTNTSVTANADATDSDLKVEQGKLKSAEDRKEELTQSISALKSTASTLSNDLASKENELKGQEDEFAELDKALKKVQEILKGLGDGVTIENLAEKIEEITEDKKKKEVAVDELNTNIGTAEKKLADLKADLDRLVKRDVERNSNIASNSREAVISSVDQDWGFVVIGAGSNSGFAPQSTLIIKRDGQVIGRLRPSSIEPSQTIAEIEFNSLSPGVRIQPGDRVIPQKPVTR